MPVYQQKTKIKIPGYAFNAYGADRLLTMPPIPSLSLNAGLMHTAIYKVLSAFGAEATNAAWAQENILNVSYQDSGILNGDFLSNVATELTSKHLGACPRTKNRLQIP